MIQFTRRDLLKTGLGASAASLVGSGTLFSASSVGAAVVAANSSAVEPRSNALLDRRLSPREKLLLDFGWRFHLGDADDSAKDFRWGAPTREGTLAKAGQDWIHNPGDGPLQHSFNDSAWRQLDLPHDWAVELPFATVPEAEISVNAAHGGKPLGRNFPATSIGWYNRTFDIPEKDLGLRISIEFDGVFRDAIVLFNGFYIGRNLSGYAPFSFDVTDYAKYGGSNVLTVRADATLNEGWYYEGAGIYRHTWLSKTHTLHIARWGTAVRSQPHERGADIAIETEIRNESDERRIGLLASEIFDHGGKLVATIPAHQFEIAARGDLAINTQALLEHARLWSIEEPHLYCVVSRIESQGHVTDHTDTTFGIRSIRFDADHGFFLNGKPVKIQGTCNHQDHAGVGIAVPDSIHYDRVATLKGMGSNGWRTAHNIVSTEFLDSCDRLGMLVMAETRTMASTPEGLSELERMIKRDRNHPSIVIWSLANEEYFYQGTPTGARIVSSMKRLARKLDPSRPTTAAMTADGSPKESLEWSMCRASITGTEAFLTQKATSRARPRRPISMHSIGSSRSSRASARRWPMETARAGSMKKIPREDMLPATKPGASIASWNQKFGGPYSTSAPSSPEDSPGWGSIIAANLTPTTTSASALSRALWTPAGSPRTSSITTSRGGVWNRCCTSFLTGIGADGRAAR